MERYLRAQLEADLREKMPVPRRAPRAEVRPAPGSRKTSSSRRWWLCSARGTNIVTTCSGLFAGGVRLSEKNRARVLEACQKGRSSVWASGSDPGFITETLPMALLSVQRRVDLIEIEEFGDLSRRPSAHMVMDQMRFGKPLSEFDPERRKDHLYGEYQPPLSVLADMAGLAIEEWTSEGGVAAAKRDLTIVAGPIKKGTTAAQRIIIHDRSRGVDRIRFIQCGFVARDVDPDWGLQPTGWRIRIHGDAPFDLSVPFPVPLDDLASYVPAFNANGPVNAARPGILTTEDLAPILPRGPRGD